ncbi:MAG TPA: hypothetical protein VLJ79_18950, partial [Candidatus Binatia bacterium]|nr:hypothetical protein [Candidatus Binatia bacterium]
MVSLTRSSLLIPDTLAISRIVTRSQQSFILEESAMAQQPFKWPNNARIAFVLGIAFEAWDRTKP